MWLYEDGKDGTGNKYGAKTDTPSLGKKKIEDVL